MAIVFLGSSRGAARCRLRRWRRPSTTRRGRDRAPVPVRDRRPCSCRPAPAPPSRCPFLPSPVRSFFLHLLAFFLFAIGRVGTRVFKNKKKVDCIFIDFASGQIFFYSIYLKMSPLFCVCLCAVRLKRGIRTVGAKNLKKKSKKCGIVNNGRPLFGPTRSVARQPARTRSNPR